MGSEVVTILGKILALEPAAPRAVENLLCEICSTCKKLESVEDIYASVSFQLNEKFTNIDPTESNFDFRDIATWQAFLLFDSWDGEYIVSIQIIVCLVENSVVNKQLFGWQQRLKDTIISRLTKEEDFRLKYLFTELISIVFSVNASPSDIQSVLHDDPCNWHLIKNLSKQVTDISAGSYLLFENAYVPLVLSESSNRFTINTWVEFINVTSNRLMTLGTSLFVELKDSFLCLSNDEYIFAYFDSFEFEIGVLYFISINVVPNVTSLYVNGQKMQTIPLVSTYLEPELTSFELGSMVSFMKLFKLQIWKGDLLPTISGLNLDEFFLVERCEDMNLILDFDVDVFLSKCQKDDKKFLVKDISNFYEAGLCIYYKSSDMFGILQCLDFSQWLLHKFSNFDDSIELENVIDAIILVLRHPNFRINFEKIKGYSILSYLLHSKVEKGYSIKMGAVDDLLNLACTKLDRNDSSSLVTDESAFRILLNMSLFKFAPDSLSYIFERLQVLFSDTIMFQNRYEELVDFQRYLVFQFHLQFRASELESLMNIAGDSLQNLLVTLLSQNIFKGGLMFTLQFTYLTSMIGNFSLTKILLQSVSDALEVVAKEKHSQLVSTLPKKLYLKGLFVVLEACGNDFPSMKSSLSVLFQFLGFDSDYLEAFIHGAGYKIILGILSNHLAGLDSLLSFLIQDGEAGDFEVLVHRKKSWLLRDDNLSILTNLLTIQLLDWSVKNDIQFLPEKITALILKYTNLITIALSEYPFLPVFTSEQSEFCISLIELIVTLMKPQNGEIYLRCSDELSVVLSKLIIHGLKKDTNSEFISFLNTLFDGKCSKDRCYSNFLMARISPIIFLIIKEKNCINACPPNLKSVFIKNVVFYLNLHKVFLKLKFQYAQDLLGLHTTILHVKDAIDWSTQKYEIKDNQLKMMRELHSKILKNLCLKLSYGTSSFITREFLKSILYYQELMFIQNDNYMALSNECVANILEFLVFLLRHERYTEEQIMVTSAFRTICLLCESRLRMIARYLSKKPAECSKLLLDCIVLDDDSILNKITSDSACTTLKTRTYLNEMDKRETVLSSTNNLGEDAIRKEFISDLIKEVLEAQNCEPRDFLNIYRLFRRDNIALAQQMLFVEERRVSDFTIDEERHRSLSLDSMYRIEKNLASHDYLSGDLNAMEWKIDPKEDNNRTRRRLIPSFTPQFKAENFATSEIKVYQARCSESVSSRKSNRSTSSIEIMNASAELDILNEKKMDRNRVILHLLNENDVIKTIWNGTKITGFKIQEGIIILGSKYLYFVPGYYFDSEGKKVIDIKHVSPCIRDTTIELITNGPNSAKKNPAEVLPSHSYNPIFWDLESLLNVTKRPFLLRDVALELYFKSNENIMFSLKTQGLRDHIYGKLDKLRSHNKRGTIWDSILENVNLRSINVGLKNGISETSLTDRFTNVLSGITKTHSNLEVTDLWINGKISNFDYLMAINTLAGRTFNDITQYPVFPWVIRDYESVELDLSDPLSFRDLSKPMGAQTSNRMEQFKERYEAIQSLNDTSTPPFHYGTHYSSAMIVSSYLMRLQPYANSFLLLQGGQWGPPERLFNSISRAWKQASEESTTDVRELIPEFFYLPDFLENKNKYHFGTLQNGKDVQSVSLPTWANNDPKLFVEMNRQALESDYVSQHLHGWIDLVFGYKQRGRASVDAVNVFNHLSYPGSVNLSEINNEPERKALTGIIHNFGQTPLQIFDSSHPQKLKNLDKKDYISYLYSLKDNLKLVRAKSPATLDHKEDDDPGDVFSIKLRGKRIFKAHSSPIVFKERIDNETYVTADELGLIKIWKMKHGALLNHLCLSGHGSKIKDIKIIYQYNTLVSLDFVGKVLCWDFINGQLLRKLCDGISLFSVSETTGNTAVIRENQLIIFDINGSVFSKMELYPGITAIDFAFHKYDWIFNYCREKELIFLARDRKVEILTFCARESEWLFLPLLTLEQEKVEKIEKIKAEAGICDKYGTFTFKLLIQDSDGKAYAWKSE